MVIPADDEAKLPRHPLLALSYAEDGSLRLWDLEHRILMFNYKHTVGFRNVQYLNRDRGALYFIYALDDGSAGNDNLMFI